MNSANYQIDKNFFKIYLLHFLLKKINGCLKKSKNIYHTTCKFKTILDLKPAFNKLSIKY